MFFTKIIIVKSNKTKILADISVFHILVIAMMFIISEFNSTHCQILNEALWVPNSTVFTTFRSGNTIYIGGAFTVVGPSTGHGAAIDIISAEPNLDYPKVNGHIFAVANDGTGGWYVGGSFSNVGGIERNNIAHIYHDGTLDLNWNPNASNSVWSLFYYNSIVYVGGNFTQIGGAPRNYVAALNPITGNATNWNPGANNTVRAIIVLGSSVFCGGLFTSVGGEPRNYIAEIDVNTGIVTGWNPSAGNYIYALAVSGSTLYVGGDFTEIGGETRNRIAAINIVTGTVLNWDPNASFTVLTLTVSGSNVYVGGWFTVIGGQPRNRIAAIDTSTGIATSWNPNSDSRVSSVIIQDSKVYVGGNFSNIGGEDRKKIAELDIVTGNATSWDPFADREILTLAASSSTIYAGGRFSSIGGVERNRIAAIDVITGTTTDWNPGANDYVDFIDVSNSTVYVGGAFTNIGGEQRNHIAALDAESGFATNWDPNANNDVVTIFVCDSVVYAGGYFTNIGGTSRNYIAALDKTTGSATIWNPNSNSYVRSIEVVDSIVYTSGYFTKIGSQNPQPVRNRIAALKTKNGIATDWNPNANGVVWCIEVDDSVIYIGGEFNNIGGEQRYCIAAVQVNSGLATDWNPIATGGGPPMTYVRVMEKSGSLIYAGGSFSWIGNESRKSIAALDVANGRATLWDPNPITYPGDPPSEIYAMDVKDSTVYMGGLFYEVLDKVQQIFAGVTEDIVPVEMISFTGTSYPNQVELIWSTATEINNQGFEIHRKSQNRNEWQTIGFVPGFGTTTEPKSYSYIDERVISGNYRYRLKQIDFDGSFTYSNEIEVVVDFTPKEFVLYQNYPNPFNPNTVISYQLPVNGNATLKVYDVLGNEVAILVNDEKQPGVYKIEFDASMFSSGIYFYQLKAGNYIQTKKMVLMK
jgi:trimeric autotransporter adhesin